jgi:hypothetical protein
VKKEVGDILYHRPFSVVMILSLSAHYLRKMFILRMISCKLMTQNIDAKVKFGSRDTIAPLWLASVSRHAIARRRVAAASLGVRTRLLFLGRLLRRMSFFFWQTSLY